MKYTSLAAGVALALVGMNNVHADDTERRLARLEAMLAQMQQRLDAQSEKIRVQEATIERQQEAIRAAGIGREDGGASPGVGISGLVEVEAGYHSPYRGDSENDVVLATFELGFAARVNDWVEAGGSLLYEEDETDLELDTGYVTLANADASPLYLIAGRFYLPFGAYETSLVSDPLTLELGEIRETAVQAGYDNGSLAGSLYLFNGTNREDGGNRVGAWGVSLGYGRGWDNGGWSLGAGYLSDLGDADGLQELIADTRGDNDIDRRVGGWTLNAVAQFGPFSLVGEYLTAADRFDTTDVPWRLGGAEPRAFNLEAGYGFDLLGRAATLALAWQGSREALALELPRERWLLGLSLDLLDSTALAFEWARDQDYSVADGGTGESGDTLTAQLAVEF